LHAKIHPAFAIIHFSSLFRLKSLKRGYEKWFIVLFILTMLGMIFSILMAFHLLKKKYFFFWCF